jgi:hypothetical protein
VTGTCLPPAYHIPTHVLLSYTDEGRLSYFLTHNSQAPPPGTVFPESNATAGGGLTWPRWIAKKTGVKSCNYAVSGAVCSNNIVARDVTPNFLFPDVLGYEIPALKADLRVNTIPGINAKNTLYALWIGTNDLGGTGFLG